MEIEKFRVDWGLSGRSRRLRQDNYIWVERLDFNKSQGDRGFYAREYRQLSFKSYLALVLAGQIVEDF